MKFVFIAFLLASSACAADSATPAIAPQVPRAPKRVWIRRATLIAGCAASLAFDTLSTRRAVNSGAVEANGFFANSAGQPQYGRMIAIKSSLCGVATVLQETHILNTWRTARADWTWTGVNLGTTALYTWAGFHNLKLANDLQGR